MLRLEKFVAVDEIGLALGWRNWGWRAKHSERLIAPRARKGVSHLFCCPQAGIQERALFSSI